MHKIISIGVVSACMLTFANSGKAAAQYDSTRQAPGDASAGQELEEVTVIALRSEASPGRAAMPATVITAEDIAAAPVRSIEDLLVHVAGMDAAQRGGYGVQADISIRGGSADQTAILLNGVNLSSPHTGHYSLDFPINLSDIERIEILYGPSALIYGLNAFSGGINIITKKTGSELYAKLESGMYRFFDTEMRGAINLANTGSSLSLGRRSSGGYTDNSDFDLYNALWQTRLHVDGASHLDFLAGYNHKDYGANTFYSAAYPNQYERTSSMVGAVSGVFGSRLKLIPQLYWTRHQDQFDLIKNTGTGRNYHRSDTYGASMMFRTVSPFGATHFGGEIRRETILSSKLGKPLSIPNGRYTMADSRTQAGFMLEHTLHYAKFVFSAGALAGCHALQNDRLHLYPSVHAAYSPAGPLKIHAAWSRSGRMPTFTDIYYTTETHQANEALQAEFSESFDLGVKYRNSFIEATFTGYVMNGRNMIDWIRNPGETKWASWNHTEINRQGYDAALKVPLYNVMPFPGKTALLSVSYSHINQHCNSRGMESRYTLNYLRDKLTVNFRHPVISNLTASWYFRYQDRTGEFYRYEDGREMGMTPFPPFSTLDVKLMYKAGKVTVDLHLNNIFDTRYDDVGNVPQAGFWLTGGVSCRY
jgi:iron complex outermembrane receptor protein